MSTIFLAKGLLVIAVLAFFADLGVFARRILVAMTQRTAKIANVNPRVTAWAGEKRHWLTLNHTRFAQPRK